MTRYSNRVLSVLLWFFGGTVYFFLEVAYKTIAEHPERISWTMLALAIVLSIPLERFGAELNDERTNYEAMAEGGYGGGAAYKANGGNGGDGIEADTSSSGNIYVEPGVGGAGADALAPPKKANYGSGGDGGNGGGGGGGGGLGRATARGDDYTFHNERSRGGPGGKGSAGGEGADGCIFLYYQRPESVDSGALVSSDSKYLLDSLGRYIVV